MAMRLEPALNFQQISIEKYGFEVRIEKAQLKAAWMDNGASGQNGTELWRGSK